MLQSSSATASTSTSTAPNSDYDVFINHRGPDVKKTFASHLYRRLQSYGLRVFLDQPELQRGDYLTPQIEGAIGSASIHVAIFSSRYAESTWCLKELVLMLESNSPIIPVFYQVKPDELRWTRGNGGYAKALELLERKTTTDPETGEKKLRYDPSLIENWRDGLFKAAGISGFELEARNGDEGELLDNVVEEVLKRAKKPALNVAKYPTGLDDKVTDFENIVLLPRQNGGKPRILGIVGLGGVGKTTLAKELFNRKSSGYSRSCFLADVRDNANKGTLNLLQRELLKSLTGRDEPINSVHHGKTILKMHISSPNLLIILDDVDKVDQVDEFLPDQTVLHSDSLILITSRNKDVLKRSGVEELSIYKLTGLSREQSLELFCLYSFNQAHPLPEFESLVEKFIEACGGLPLSLKVFGALLHGENTSYWKAQLDKLQRILPKEIKQRLQISYDALDMEEQQIFLDIACFFIGEDRDMAIRISDGSGRNGLWGFRNIENRCLVEVNSNNTIRMHDHLRDMGREIADASLPRRLWCPTPKIDDLLQQLSSEQVINEVRGITMRYDMPRFHRSSKLLGNCFMKLCNTQYPFHGTGICMRNLQLLHTGGDLVERILTKVQLPNLIWLNWENCPYSSLPSSISMKNLMVLHVSGSKLKTLWKKESQAPLQLRELEIIAPLSNIPKSIGKLTQLERIVIGYYYGTANVTQLPEEFCLLQSLKALVLEGLSEMKSLPQSFGKLTNLQQISLWGCQALNRLPESFGNLTNLQEIKLTNCMALKTLPDSFGNLTNLQEIQLPLCTNMKRLPESLGNLTNLQNMDLAGSHSLVLLPGSLGNLTSLHHIELSGCSSLRRLPTSLGNLTSLHHHIQLSGCSSLRRLPTSLGNLTSLHHIELSSCYSLRSLPNSLGNLTNLHRIELSRCSLLKRMPDSLGNLTSLHHIDLSHCFSLERLPDCFGNLIKLRHLDLSYCSNLTLSSETLGNISTLVCINLRGCKKIEVLPQQVVHQVSLQKLYLTGTKLRELPSAIGELRDLEVLEVGPLLDTPPSSLCSLKSLKELQLYKCKELKCLPASLGDITNLKKLIIQHCKDLKCLPHSLGRLTQLTELKVEDCPLIRELAFKEEVKGEGETWSDLESSIDQCILPRLQMLDISGTGISEVSFAEGVCFNLQTLIIDRCNSVVELGTLPNTLVTLRLIYCHSLRKLDKIYGLAKLHVLDISDCIELEELPCIEALVSLRELCTGGCVKLKSIRGLGALTELEELSVSRCSELEELEGIQHCTSLRLFDAEGCLKLQCDATLRRLGHFQYDF